IILLQQGWGILHLPDGSLKPLAFNLSVGAVISILLNFHPACNLSDRVQVKRHSSTEITFYFRLLAWNMNVSKRVITDRIVTIVKQLQQVPLYPHLIPDVFEFNFVRSLYTINGFVVVVIVRYVGRSVKELVTLTIPVEGM